MSCAKITYSVDTKSADIIFILDESGSMESLGTEPVQAVNSFINDQKKSTPPGVNSTFTLWKFNSNVTLSINEQDLKTIGTFSDYHPDNMTALYDAIGKAIVSKKLSGKNLFGVVCVILTDGEENSSKEYNSFEISNLTKEMQEKWGWKFIYLGANQDAFKVGAQLGIQQTSCTSFSTNNKGMTKSLNIASKVCSSFRSLSIK